MLKKGEEDLITRVDTCAVCGNNNLDEVIELPNLPLTALFSSVLPDQQPRGYNQTLLFCQKCGHAQLGYQISSKILYDNKYGFRTSISTTARAGTQFFLDSLHDFVGAQHFQCVIDWGCNDLYLLKQLEHLSEERVGIDPIWNGRESENTEVGIKVIGNLIEEIDLEKVLEKPPDLILCRHTIEHISDPKSVLRKLIQFAAPNAIFIFETPNFDTLIDRGRFDQIFHQHLQYFSLRSFHYLFHELGVEFLGFKENYHDWGALLVVFRKSTPQISQPIQVKYDICLMKTYYKIFQEGLISFRRLVDASKYRRQIFGYGAAEMLPVLAYHLETDLSFLTAILDDNSARDGWYYQNLPTPIWFADRVDDLSDSSVMLTAIDNAVPILLKLFQRRPKQILLPINII